MVNLNDCQCLTFKSEWPTFVWQAVQVKVGKVGLRCLLVRGRNVLNLWRGSLLSFMSWPHIPWSRKHHASLRLTPLFKMLKWWCVDLWDIWQVPSQQFILAMGPCVDEDSRVLVLSPVTMWGDDDAMPSSAIRCCAHNCWAKTLNWLFLMVLTDLPSFVHWTCFCCVQAEIQLLRPFYSEDVAFAGWGCPSCDRNAFNPIKSQSCSPHESLI